MSHGLTELMPDEFRKAVKNLQVPWADDINQLNSVHSALDHDVDKEQRGALGLDEIALGIHDCVVRTLQDYENDYLDITYTILKTTGKLTQLKDIMRFLNYSRDYSCTVPQFLQLFRENFAIEAGALDDW